LVEMMLHLLVPDLVQEDTAKADTPLPRQFVVVEEACMVLPVQMD
jgi:hypothetical protein